ncbi:unnamed protein product, partial [Ixodes persulcatus]
LIRSGPAGGAPTVESWAPVSAAHNQGSVASPIRRWQQQQQRRGRPGMHCSGTGGAPFHGAWMSTVCIHGRRHNGESVSRRRVPEEKAWSEATLTSYPRRGALKCLRIGTAQGWLAAASAKVRTRAARRPHLPGGCRGQGRLTGGVFFDAASAGRLIARLQGRP